MPLRGQHFTTQRKNAHDPVEGRGRFEEKIRNDPPASCGGRKVEPLVTSGGLKCRSNQIPDGKVGRLICCPAFRILQRPVIQPGVKACVVRAACPGSIYRFNPNNAPKLDRRRSSVSAHPIDEKEWGQILNSTPQNIKKGSVWNRKPSNRKTPKTRLLKNLHPMHRTTSRQAPRCGAAADPIPHPIGTPISAHTFFNASDATLNKSAPVSP